MKFNAECLKPRRVALWIAMISLSGCAMGGSERALGVCPPVVEYDGGFRMRAAGEVKLLPEGSVVVEMLSDYAVLREQLRGCFVR